MGSTTNTNTCVISGNLVRDAELKEISPEFSVLNFTVAVNESVKKADAWESYANFLDVSITGKRAQALAKYMCKGKRVVVEGKIHQDRWEKDGQKQSRIIIRAESVEMMGGSQDGAAPANHSDSGNGGNNGNSDFTDDVPFWC